MNLSAAILDPMLRADPVGPRITYYDDDTGVAGDNAANTAMVLRTFDNLGTLQALPGDDDSTGLGTPNGISYLCGLVPDSAVLRSIGGSQCTAAAVANGGGTGTTSTTTVTTPGTTTPGSSTTTPGGSTTVVTTTTTPGSTKTKTKTVTKKTCTVPKRLSYVQHPAYPVRETRAVVYINGKKAKTVAGKRIVDVVMIRPKATKFTLKLVATLSDGEVVSHSYSYKGCKLTASTYKVLSKPTHRA